MNLQNPTIDELKNFAELANEAYKDYHTGEKFPPNKELYTVIDVLNDRETGVYAFLAEDGQGNKYIVIRGTEGFSNAKDVANDIDILMGKAPEQLKVAQRWINDLKDRRLISESDNVYAVGHSLGGYLAN